MEPLSFVHALSWADLPAPVRARARICLLDLLGIAAAGHSTTLSRIARDHAAEDMPGTTPLLFDDRSAAPAAAALAAGMSIDSLDGHDGYNPAKGHIGCPLLPALLVFGHQADVSGQAFLASLIMGYEFGARISVAQHATAPDYHTSGSWGAVVAAAAGARLLGLDAEQTRHALGIAEYHGPRSQMMRCIDTPTMLKDGSGWGALAGVSAVQMARRGFTGAPAITVEETPAHWADLGQVWRCLEQYFKPFPVCRWAQGPMEAVLALRQTHGLHPDQVDHIEIETFTESCRLATREPKTIEEAQYSTSFPTAVAMVHGDLRPEHITGAALQDAEVLRLSRSMVMQVSDHADAAFPEQRFARVTVMLRNGDRLASGWVEPAWGPTNQPSDDEIRDKYLKLASPALGSARAEAILAAVDALERTSLKDLTRLLYKSPAP